MTTFHDEPVATMKQRRKNNFFSKNIQITKLRPPSLSLSENF